MKVLNASENIVQVPHEAGPGGEFHLPAGGWVDVDPAIASVLVRADARLIFVNDDDARVAPAVEE